MSIAQEAVQQVLQLHLLPRLDADALARLACVSRQLRALVYYAPLPVWTAAARDRLPVACKLPHPCTRASLQAALCRYSAALLGISTAKWHHHISWSFPEPRFSCSGKYLASFVNSSVKIRDVHTGTLTAKVHLAGDGFDWLCFQWSNQDTHAGVVLKSQGGEPRAGTGDMLAAAVHQQGWAAMHQVPLPHHRWSWERFDGPRWSPDLTKLLATELSEVGGSPIGTAVLDVQSGATLWSTQQSIPALPIWRPDGAALLYFARVSALRSQRHCEQVVSVPEGRTVYSSTRAAGDGHTASNKHAFSANGQLVCSTWPVQRTAAVVRLSDGAQVLTLRGTGRNLVVSSSICWAPDNAQIAACCAPATVTHHDRQALICVWHVGHLEAAGASVCLAQLVNSDPGVRITADPMMHWSPDALHLAVLCPTDSVADQISIVAVSGMVVVCTLQAEIFALGPRFYMFEMGWSPDASALVVSFVHANALTNGGENGTAEDQKEFAGAIVSFVDAEVVM